jgi:hypothetical protein
MDALRDAEQWSVIPVIQRCYTSLGLLAEARGDVPSAEYAFKRAIASIEETRAPLPAEEFRTAFLADKLMAYTEMVRLCLAEGTPSRVAEALGYVERARSRALVDMLVGTLPATPRPRDAFETSLTTRLEMLHEELNWYYSQINRSDSEAVARGAGTMTALYDAVREREAAISEITLQRRQRPAHGLTQAAPFDLIALMSDLGEETALVEYFSLDGELLAFVVTGDGIGVVRLSGAEADVEAVLRQFHFQLGALRHGVDRLRHHLPALLTRARDHLCTLYDWLLRPIEGLLGRRRLLVVPHRVLHYVPFQALCDGFSYVIERREVGYAPSAAVLRHACPCHGDPFNARRCWASPMSAIHTRALKCRISRRCSLMPSPWWTIKRLVPHWSSIRPRPSSCIWPATEFSDPTTRCSLHCNWRMAG